MSPDIDNAGAQSLGAPAPASVQAMPEDDAQQIEQPEPEKDMDEVQASPATSTDERPDNEISEDEEASQEDDDEFEHFASANVASGSADASARKRESADKDSGYHSMESNELDQLSESEGDHDHEGANENSNGRQEGDGPEDNMTASSSKYVPAQSSGLSEDKRDGASEEKGDRLLDETTDEAEQRTGEDRFDCSADILVDDYPSSSFSNEDDPQTANVKPANNGSSARHRNPAKGTQKPLDSDKNRLGSNISRPPKPAVMQHQRRADALVQEHAPDRPSAQGDRSHRRNPPATARANASGNIFNPFVFFPYVWHVCSSCPFLSALTALITVVWIWSLCELSMLQGTAVDLSPRAISPSDNWFAGLLKRWDITERGILVLVHIDSVVGILIWLVSYNCTIAYAESPSKKNPDAWWRRPSRWFRPLARVFKLLFHVFTMDANFDNFFGRATWRTYMRFCMFFLQVIITSFIVWEAFIVTEMAAGSSDPDLGGSFHDALAEAAKYVSTQQMLYVWHCLSFYLLVILTVSWYALLHPRPLLPAARRPGFRTA